MATSENALGEALVETGSDENPPGETGELVPPPGPDEEPVPVPEDELAARLFGGRVEPGEPGVTPSTLPFGPSPDITPKPATGPVPAAGPDSTASTAITVTKRVERTATGVVVTVTTVIPYK